MIVRCIPINHHTLFTTRDRFFWVATESSLLKKHHIFTTFLSQFGFVQSPGDSLLSLVANAAGILFHFYLFAPSRVLYASRFLRPPPVWYFRLPRVSVIYLPPSCSFRSNMHFVSICSSPAPLSHYISMTYLMNTVSDSQVYISGSLRTSLSLVKTRSAGD